MESTAEKESTGRGEVTATCELHAPEPEMINVPSSALILVSLTAAWEIKSELPFLLPVLYFLFIYYFFG
jgi:hypothetical protein